MSEERKSPFVYKVFEYKGGGKICVSKGFPTWLGAKRVRNRIHRESPYFRHTVEIVEERL